ncbi:PAS/Protein phosphatase 2C-like [Labilithrix luteola]|uniref:PAS/Protein phosphatase 2C-like n=1 Tax=Labilithrix luteola TaxID=1391654 RepID=A0A0K1Q4S4_9BACT|nr:PAS/Protein phosphatase 2C-like [Labilithrix luteola]
MDTSLVNAAFRRTPNGVVLVDARGVVVLVNDAARMILGRADIGGHLSRCVPATYGIDRDDGTTLPLEETAIARALFRRERVVDEPYRVRRQNGRIVHVRATATPLDDADGRSVGAMVVLRVVDEESPRREERTRVVAERRFEALIKATAQVVWTTNATGLVVVDSLPWRAYTGQTFEDYRGYGWLPRRPRGGSGAGARGVARGGSGTRALHDGVPNTAVRR